MTDQWYSEGLDTAQKVIATEAAERERRRTIPRRFYVKKGMQATVMFIDDAGFNFWEHIPYIPGNPGNEFTCSQLQGLPCAGCEKKVWKKYVSAFTILDLTAYEGKNGTIVNERRLLATPPDFSMKIRNWKAQPDNELLRWKSGTLKARKFTVYRGPTDDDNIASGGWTPVAEPPLTKEILQGMRDGAGNSIYPTLQPYDYRAILKPLAYEDQLAKLVGHVQKSWNNKKDAGAVTAPNAPQGHVPQGNPGASVSLGVPEGNTPDAEVPF